MEEGSGSGASSGASLGRKTLPSLPDRFVPGELAASYCPL